MKWLLGPEGREALRALAAGPALVAFDFDGTLAPIVGDRDAAALRPKTLALLQRVARRYPAVVLTGRGRADARRRLPGVALRAVIGNHGAEQPAGGPASERWRTRVHEWTRSLRALARTLPGVELEEKSLSLSVHYRHAVNPKLARLRLWRAAQALDGARVIGGKRIVSVVPADAPHKGHALADAVRTVKAGSVLFLGDDDTDEDAFGHELGVPGLLVRVGRSTSSRAGYYLRNQTEVDALLEALLAPIEPVPTLAPVLSRGLLAFDFLRALWELDHALNARSKRMLGTIGVTGPQRLVVRALGRTPGASPAELARLLHLHAGSVTRLVSKLEKSGFVARETDPADTRKLRLRLTAQGRRIDASRSGTIESAVEELLARVPAERVAEAQALLQTLAAALHGHAR